jgi:hypothetical protein
MTTRPAISVTPPLGLAIERVKRVLFQPFDLGKWFVIGFCAWLAHLGEAGFHANFNFNTGSKSGNLRNELERAREYVMANLYWIVPVAIAVILLSIALWVLITWLSSRGRFMFVHCVALDRAEVRVPWRQYAREANSLFWFRLLLGLISFVISMPLFVIAGVAVYRMIARGRPDVGGIVMLLGLVFIVICMGIFFALISKFTTDFVVPVMFLRRNRCLEAWRIFGNLLAGNIGHFILYVLFQIVLWLAIAVMILAVVLMTCCIAGCLLAIPYLGTVLLLPVLMFSRSYSLHYLAQYGPEYDVFAPPAASV